MIGEFAGLGLVVASVVVRAAQPALADGLDTAGAAAGPLQALLGKPETTEQFKNKIARQLETSIDRQYRYAAPDDRLQAAKAVTRLFGSECLTAEDLVVETARTPTAS